MNDEQNLPDVEKFNSFNVGFSYLRFYRTHPEIGKPTAEQEGDVGGFQNFTEAKLSWTGEKVAVDWYGNNAPRPDWMEGVDHKEFEV